MYMVPLTKPAVNITLALNLNVEDLAEGSPKRDDLLRAIAREAKVTVAQVELRSVRGGSAVLEIGIVSTDIDNQVATLKGVNALRSSSSLSFGGEQGNATWAQLLGVGYNVTRALIEWHDCPFEDSCEPNSGGLSGQSCKQGYDGPLWYVGVRGIFFFQFTCCRSCTLSPSLSPLSFSLSPSLSLVLSIG